MEGDEEKLSARSRCPSLQAGTTDRLMGGGQTINKGCYKKRHETATRNLTASGAGGEDFEHFFMRTTAKGDYVRRITTILQIGGVSKCVPNCGRRFFAVPCLARRSCSLPFLQFVWLHAYSENACAVNAHSKRVWNQACLRCTLAGVFLAGLGRS